MNASPLRIEYLPLASLTPYENNARTHSADQVNQLAESIRTFGWSNPILVDESGLIIAGHGRLAAAAQLGLAEVPVIRLEGLTDQQKRALSLADNKLALNAGWDEKLLVAELSGLGELQGLVGFSADELMRLLGGHDGLTDPDEVPPVLADPITQAGDLWLLGPHRLLCGDATSTGDAQHVMDGRTAMLVATDPPYCVDYSGGFHPSSKSNGGKANKDKDWSTTYRETEISDAPKFFREFIAAGLTITHEQALWYIWHADRRSDDLLAAMRENTLLMHQTIVWVKPRPVLTYSHYMVHHEPCFYGWKKSMQPAPDRRPPANETNVWEVGSTGLDARDIHPTQKPIDLIRRPIEWHTRVGESIYEPFSGSGTAIIAAEMTGRVCHALEISPAYCDVAVTRWENFTGRKAERRPAHEAAA